MSLYLGENLISGNKPINLGVRNIGEIVPSAIPLTDAGLHLLDGSLIQGSGIYQGFVDYIADLYTDNPTANYFTDETTWQSSVTTYGSCGKFVYDSVNNTVRLPKVSDILQGTTDLTALGNLVASGLPQHTHTRGSMDITANWKSNRSVLKGGSTFTGAFSSSTFSNSNYSMGWNSDAGTGGSNIDFKASNNWTGSTSNANYTATTATTSKVQPQTIKVLCYIVIANSTKTEIQSDIDEIATDLNGKADTDLTNVTDTGYIKMAKASMPSRRYIDLTFTPNTNYTAPADGYFVACRTGNTGQYFNMYNQSTGTATNQARLATGLNAPSNGQYRFWVPIAKGDKIYIGTNFSGSNATYDYFGFIYAQGSESEAS